MKSQRLSRRWSIREQRRPSISYLSRTVDVIGDVRREEPIGVRLLGVSGDLDYESAAIAGLAAAAFAILTQPGPGAVWRNDWPLLALGAAGLVLLIRDESRSAVAAFVLGVGLLLGAVYLWKNPSLERYFTLLLPLAALLAGMAVAALPPRTRPLALGAIALAVVGGFLHPVPGSRDHDMFSEVAKRVAPTLESRALVTAAPDAYGFWLPTHTAREMRAGARGVILLDAAQRLYEPRLTAKGTVVRHVAGEIAFSHPNGEIDADPAVLVAGTVVVARASSSFVLSARATR